MKIDDIAKQLANKVNQEHYIKHYLEKVQRGAYDKGIKDAEAKQLILSDVSKRYDVSKYTPPFRVGRKQGKAVLDGTGREVIFFSDSEEQAKMYCDYLNNVC